MSRFVCYRRREGGVKDGGGEMICGCIVSKTISGHRARRQMQCKDAYAVNEPRRDTSHLASHHSTRSIVISHILMQIAPEVSFEC